MRVLLISTYELGRQPIHVASPAAALRRAGHEVRALDLSVQPWDSEAVAWAEAVGISVFMHTSMRLALRVAERLRRERPGLPLCLYGLYAPVSRDLTLRRFADRVIAGEYEPGLLAWVEERSGRAVPSGERFLVHLGRSEFTLPARDLLPPLDRYAHLQVDGEHRLAGAVEASHGCSEQCRHCPVPAVYRGRTRVLDVDLVLADVEQLRALGARHITFADNDFFSGPAHALRVVRGFARCFPDLTFDITTKVEHILRHESVWRELAAAGCLFVTSAVECLDDRTLAILDKGHTATDAERAVVLLREHGIEPHPSFLPFTPWTTPRSLLDILDFVARHDLVPVVDPVQYSLRLLVPEGSLLLERPELAPHLAGYDPEGLTWRWHAPDPAMDALQRELAELVAAGVEAGWGPLELYGEVRARVERATGDRGELVGVSVGPGRGRLPQVRAGSVEGRPRLTEPWFC